MNLKTATFGSGCFWCTEAIFELVDGVEDVISGYSAGNTENPTYKDVTSGTTNHAEVVNVIYNPSKISYLELLEIFWRTHDPTTLNRQGNDVGTQYRSIIFFENKEEEKIIKNFIIDLQKNVFNEKIVTEVKKFEEFYEAEDYHQNFYKLNEDYPYCKMIITPKINELRKKLNKYYK